jgi:hypothetical protein
MAGMAGVLGDHVVVDPPQADLAAHEWAGLLEAAAGGVDPGLGDLVLPRRPSAVEADGFREVEATVRAVGVGGRVVDGWCLLAQQHAAEPVPLDLGHVLHEPEERQG